MPVLNLTPLSQPLKALAFGLLGLCLAWVVVSRGLVAHLAATDPNLALRLNPGYSGALVRLADIALQTELSPPKAAHADRATGAPASEEARTAASTYGQNSPAG